MAVVEIEEEEWVGLSLSFLVTEAVAEIKLWLTVIAGLVSVHVEPSLPLEHRLHLVLTEND